jgi:hypothetical protein
MQFGRIDTFAPCWLQIRANWGDVPGNFDARVPRRFSTDMYLHLRFECLPAEVLSLCRVH